MCTTISTNIHFSTSADAVAFLLKKAKQVHRLALSTSTVSSLPVLRRLIANNVFINISLIALNKQKSMIKRKHILQLFSLEAGHSQWGDYRQFLVSSVHWKNDNYLHAMTYGSYPNLWFSTMEQAIEYTQTNAGKALKVGRQATVIDVVDSSS